MTTNEKRFYAFAKSIVDEPDTSDMIPIFKSEHWELIGMYCDTYYLVYIKNEEEYYNEELIDLDEALDKPVALAGGQCLRDYLRSISFAVTMSPEPESDFKYYI